MATFLFKLLPFWNSHHHAPLAHGGVSVEAVHAQRQLIDDKVLHKDLCLAKLPVLLPLGVLGGGLTENLDARRRVVDRRDLARRRERNHLVPVKIDFIVSQTPTLYNYSMM